MKRMLIASTLALIVLHAGPALAQGQLAIFVRFEYIHGTSLDPDHQGWIEALSIAQSVKGTSQYSPCTIELTKSFDVAGGELFRAAATGERFRRVTIEVVMPGQTPRKLYRMNLDAVAIPSFTAKSDDGFVERVQVRGERAELTAWSYAADGSPSGQESHIWDCHVGRGW